MLKWYYVTISNYFVIKFQTTLLEEYEGERKKTNMAMMAILDGFQKIYSTDFGPFNIARAAGFNAVHLLGPLKKQIISYAMGGR